MCAILVLLVVLLMPGREESFIGAYDFRGAGDKARDVPLEVAKLGDLQAAVQANPGDGYAAEKLASLLQDLERHDMAIRVSGASAAIEDPSNWRALSAVSAAYVSKATKPVAIDGDAIRESFVWANLAIENCKKVGSSACPTAQELRLRLMYEDLKYGVEMLEKGSFSPEDFRGRLSGTRPMIRATQ